MKGTKTFTWEHDISNILSYLTDKKVIIACSGGPDSMGLLEIVRLWYGKKTSETIVVGHIHHGLRKSAERDQKIVQEYCYQHHIPYECLRVDVQKESGKTKTTIEECARNIRKEWLETVRKKYHAHYILTAHHADDQAETILYRITKGTSITGLTGIEQYAGYYFRPLLQLKKCDILAYVRYHKIPYGDDETNQDTSIPRNLLRCTIIPQLKQINPEVEQALSRLSNSAGEIKKGFDMFFATMLEDTSFSYDWYHSLPLGFQHELLRYLYEIANGSTHGLSTARIQEIDRFLSTRTGGKKEYGKKWLSKKHGRVLLT